LEHLLANKKKENTSRVPRKKKGTTNAGPTREGPQTRKHGHKTRLEGGEALNVVKKQERTRNRREERKQGKGEKQRVRRP